MTTTGLLILCLSVLATVQARPGAKCTKDRECDAGECCQILSAYPVFSKRRIAFGNKSTNTGTCQRYKTEGQFCSPFEKRNGYCGCAPGLKCKLEKKKKKTKTSRSETQELSPLEKRRIRGPNYCRAI